MTTKEIRDLIKNNRSIRKQILLTPIDQKHLKIVSDHTKLSENEIINKALNAYLARYKKYFEEYDNEVQKALEDFKKLGSTHADMTSLN